jgi:hypothetical protein
LGLPLSSKGGRLALLAAALDSLPTYFMASLLLPILILQKIDRKRKSFFWAGEDHCSGAQCLVAWDMYAYLNLMEALE